MRRPIARILLAALAATLAGCGVVSRSGMADRCADFMTRADPGASIDITESRAAPTSLTRIVATVEGVRTNLPAPAGAPRRLAVECRFDNGILTGFRWTKGPG